MDRWDLDGWIHLNIKISVTNVTNKASSLADDFFASNDFDNGVF